MERCESIYDNMGGVYREIKEGCVYPPHLGYSEFTTSTSSLGFETETFSELFFSSSSEDEDSSVDYLLGPETPGILYKISRQLEKVPRYFSARKQIIEQDDEFLNLSEGTDHLLQLQDSVESMIENIKIEETLFFKGRKEIEKVDDDAICSNLDSSIEVNCDPVQSLNAIETQISDLIKVVEKEEELIKKQLKEKENNYNSLNTLGHYRRLYQSSDSSDSDDDDMDTPKVKLSVGKRFGMSTIDISTTGGTLKKQSINRSLPNMTQYWTFPPFQYDDTVLEHTSSIEYITPKKGLGFVNSGYCIWTSDEDLLEGSVEEWTKEEQTCEDKKLTQENQQKSHVAVVLNQKVMETEAIINGHPPEKDDTKELTVSREALQSSEKTVKETHEKDIFDLENVKKATEETILVDEIKEPVLEEIKDSEFGRSLDMGEYDNIQSQDVDRVIKEMESKLITSNFISDETETEPEDSPKPYVTTPSLSRRGIGGSQRLQQEERPTVRIVTDFAEDSSNEDDEDGQESSYYVTEPTERPKRRNVKFRFDSDDYRDDEESDKETEEKSTKTRKDGRVEKKFERMASETKENELEKSDGEFQNMISQMSVEEMDEALQLWDKGGLTPSDLDSKSLTEPSDETSPQEGTQVLEDEERTVQSMPPPIPSPRAQSVPFEPPKDDLSSQEELLTNYASKKLFWEQVSHGSTEKQETVIEKPPVPKPRLSITGSIERPIYTESSHIEEVSEIDKQETLSEATSTETVARGLSKEESIDDSEIEYIQTHRDELSYDNDAFDLDDNVEELSDFSLSKKKKIYERSVSLPCDSSLDPSTSSVRTKKRIFEAQIKKEMVVEQLMSQLEEEASPEHKSLKHKTEKPITDTQAMVTRQIHTEIFSDELDQQIDSLVPENKELRQQPFPKDIEKLEATFLETSSPETSISSSVAEVLQYKSDAISKPSDSLEVHVDKSELEESEKEKDLDDDMKAIEDSRLQAPYSREKDKVGSVTSSQGESEDTFSESDVTPEDTRFKEQQDIQEWTVQEIKPEKGKKTQSIYTPEEHLPDTVWEVPVQEAVETVSEEMVQQFSTELFKKGEEDKKEKYLTESEAKEIAKEIVEDIEVEINKRESVLFEAKKKKEEISMEAKPGTDAMNRKLKRTDTTTSSMEITDEDLRSSGVDSDISPLESQACHVFRHHDQSGDDSSDDIENLELSSKETFGEDALEKTLAEVKESLEAVKEELIEEKKKKKDSITKESPSEFEFKVLSIDQHQSQESIKESHFEESSASGESRKPIDVKYKVGYSEKNEFEQSISSEIKSEMTKQKKSDIEVIQTKQERSEQEKERALKEVIIEEKKEIIDGSILIEDNYGKSSISEEAISSESEKYEESKVIGSGSSSLQSAATLQTEHAQKYSETYDFDTVTEIKKTDMTLQKTEGKQDMQTMEEENKKKTDIHVSEFISDDGTFVTKCIEKSEKSVVTKIESKHHTEKCVIQHVRQLQDFDKDQKTDDEDEKSLPRDDEEEKTEIIETKEEGSGEYSRSPVPEDTLEDTSSSSEIRMGSDTPPTGAEKPTIIIRKHSKKVSKIQGELSDPYSSSGESHYHSFEQTSESLRTPSSRPLSSDVEGLVANLAGVTGSSEYESAVSGHSTTITSRDFQTAVSSLSSRDSMKSLDSESSGNLASIEVSSEASETLVPSAMELDEMEIQTPQPPLPKKMESPHKGRSFSESNGQSVSFDISTEDMSEEEVDIHTREVTQKMKRSHEMTFQPEPRPIVDEKLCSSTDDVGSAVSDSSVLRTVIEHSRTESEKMDGSATSDQLTVSGTSEQLSLSENKDTESAMETKKGTVSTQFSQEMGDIVSVTITTSSVTEQGIPSVCTQVTSKTTSHSNGPTQVEYNIEYDEIETEVKKRPGHRRNGSTSFKPSMIPVFQGRDFEKKVEDILEDSAESDKYSQNLTSKEGSQEEKKDIDEAEKLEEEFYHTEADQGFHRDLREGRILKEVYEYEEARDYEYKSDKSRLSSVAFSEDRPDSELAELLKQCSTEGGTEDPIERPKTPEPIEECELKDDTPEFSSEAQASVTELEMEYSGAFSRSSEYEAHVSPIREKGLHWQHESEMTESESVFQSSYLTSLPETIPEDPMAEKHELETQELFLKEEIIDRTSPVPGITITQHMTPLLDESFVFPDDDECTGAMQPIPESISSKASSETSLAGKEYNLETASTKSITSGDLQDDASHTDEKTVFEKESPKEIESTSDSPTSDSFELLEKPDLADEFVIIEEVGKEAEEQDKEGKSLKIAGTKRIVQRRAEKEIVSPPTTTAKMTKIKYYTKGGAEEEGPFDFESGTPPKTEEKADESSQEGSPPSAIEDDFKPEVEAGKKWMEMQFQGEQVAPIYGYEMEFERGPLEDIKEEDLADLESSSKIGSMGSQVSYSIGSFGSVKESLSSTPDYDLIAGRKFLTRSGEHDDISMSSLQEFERLEKLIALESTKHKSLGSQDSLTSSSNSKKHGSRSGGDDISLASLKEFEGLESACIAAERIERKAKAEEESLLSEIEEGHESQASESESCVTVSVSGINRESDEDDYEKRMFEIDEIIRQAQTNVEQFMDAKSKETIEKKLKMESELALGHADSLEEMTKVPDLDLDQPTSSTKQYCGKTYITQWEDLADDLLTSTDSLELKTQISKTSIADPFTTSTDSLEVKLSQDVMSVSTDSIEVSQKKKALMTDSIEVGEKSSMITSTDSLEEKITQPNSLEEEEPHPHSSSSGKELDWSGSSSKDDGCEGAINRMPPPRAEYMLGSSDSLEPTSSTATHATYQYETDSVMSSSFTSADSTTMVDDDALEARAGVWFDDGKPYVTEVIEPGDDEFSQIIHRTVEMPPQITKVSFKGQEAEKALKEYIEKFDPGEDISETREVDAAGNVHIKRVIQKRVILRPEEMGGETTKLEGEDLENYLKSLTSCQDPNTIPESSQKFTHSSSQRTVSHTIQGETIKSQEEKETKDSQRRGGRPPLKYDISMDEEPEFDPREHDWRFNLHTHLERDEEHRIEDEKSTAISDKGSPRGLKK